MKANIEILKNKLQAKSIANNNCSYLINLKKTDLNLENITNFTDNQEINKLLENFTVEYFSYSSNQVLILGKKYQELANILGNNHKGLYTKFLIEILKVNPRTALRYRNRYIVYSKCISENAKKIISITKNEIIEFLLKNEEYMEFLEEANTKDEFEKTIFSLLESDENQTIIEENDIVKPSYVNYFNKLNKLIYKGQELNKVKKSIMELKKEIQLLEKNLQEKELENSYLSNYQIEFNEKKE